MDKSDCETCDGIGTIYVPIEVNGEPALDDVPCPDCGGTVDDDGGYDHAAHVDLELGGVGGEG